jgi:hypothetical protein
MMATRRCLVNGILAAFRINNRMRNSRLYTYKVTCNLKQPYDCQVQTLGAFMQTSNSNALPVALATFQVDLSKMAGRIPETFIPLVCQVPFYN